MKKRKEIIQNSKCSNNYSVQRGYIIECDILGYDKVNKISGVYNIEGIRIRKIGNTLRTYYYKEYNFENYQLNTNHRFPSNKIDNYLAYYL